MSMSVEATKQITLEDVIDRSRELGLTLPKNQMEAIKESLEKGTMSGQEHMQHLEKVSEKLADKGLRWATPESHQPNQPVHYLVDKYATVQAYIHERTNSKDQSTFYAANRRTFDAEKNKEIFVNFATSSSVDSLKSRIAGFYTGVAIKDVAKEASKNLEKAAPEKNPEPQKPAPSKTPDHSLSM